MARFLESLRRAAQTDATVLVVGESGTGKSRAARLLHDWSQRAASPFVAVGLAATATSLIEATLFGHERGAFTDAHRERVGLFRRAHGGTLVLDDVDHLPPAIQVKLLRALQERLVEPLGADAPVPFDVRVVATSSVPLERAIAAGRFREDLYWRLAVVTLEVPPLRARTGDLQALCEVLTGAVSERVGAVPRPLSGQALERLEQHPWPGNVRELENAIERVLALPRDAEEGRPIAPAELDFLERAREGAEVEIAEAALRQGLSVAQVTRAMMQRSLEEHRGNVSRAARAIGLTRRAFDYRLGRRGNGGEP
jgi:DNA-binding NtrC family response regulator